MASTSSSKSAFFVDTTGIKGLARDLKAVAPEAAKEFRNGLKVAGELVAEEARVRSSFSKRIPSSIKVRTSGQSVKVIAGGDTAPLAAAIENKGAGFVRHPVFGNPQVWTSKGSHGAFLGPAADAKGDAIAPLVENAVARAIDKAGLTSE